MTLFFHLLATAVTILSGLGLLSLLRRPGIRARALSERIGLGYLVGIVFVACEILLLGKVGARVSPAMLYVLQVPAVALFAIDRAKRRGRPVGSPAAPAVTREPGRLRRAGWAWIVLALIGTKLAWVLSMNLTDLLRTDDAFRCALGLARHVRDAGTIAGFDLPPGYPRLPGLILAWFGMSGGGWNEFAVNLAHWNYYAVFLLLFHANLRARTGAAESLLGTYLLSGFPLLLVHAVMVGYADLPMAIFVCFAGTYTYRFACSGNGDDLALALFFVAALPGVRLEGKVPYLPIALWSILAACAFRRGILRPAQVWLLTGALYAAAVAAVFLLERRYGVAGPPLLRGVWGNILPGNRLAQIGEPLLDHFGWAYNNWMVVGTAVAIAFPLLSIRSRRTPEGVLALYGLLLLGSFVYLYGVGGAYLWLLDGTVVDRSFLQILPALLYGAVVMISLSMQEGGGDVEIVQTGVGEDDRGDPEGKQSRAAIRSLVCAPTESGPPARCLSGIGCRPAEGRGRRPRAPRAWDPRAPFAACAPSPRRHRASRGL